MSDQPRSALVLDFDGTVCLGDDPVRFYAEEAAAHLDAPLRDPMLATVDSFLAGETRLPGCEDGYHAVAALAGEHLDRETLSQAYRASRARLDAGEGDTYAPHGLGDFLDEARGLGAAVVLVTNAPLLGVESWLVRRDLAGRLEAVVPEAGKPVGMPAVLSGVLAQYGLPAERLASVGDVWRNDVDPALALGAAGIHIDRFGAEPGPATARAGSFVDLFGVIREWLVGHASSE